MSLIKGPPLDEPIPPTAPAGTSNVPVSFGVAPSSQTAPSRPPEPEKPVEVEKPSVPPASSVKQEPAPDMPIKPGAPPPTSIKSLESSSMPSIKPLGAGAGHKFAAITIGTALAVVLVTGATYFIKSQHQGTLKQKDQEYKNEIESTLQNSKFQEQEKLVLETGGQIEGLQNAISGRIQFSQFLNQFISTAFKGAQWESFRLSEDKVTILGNTANFVDLAKTVVTLRNIKELTGVSLTAATLDPASQKVKFTIEANFDKKSLAVKKSAQTETSAAAESLSAPVASSSDLSSGTTSAGTSTPTLPTNP